MAQDMKDVYSYLESIQQITDVLSNDTPTTTTILVMTDQYSPDDPCRQFLQFCHGNFGTPNLETWQAKFQARQRLREVARGPSRRRRNHRHKITRRLF